MDEKYLGTDMALSKDLVSIPTGDVQSVTGRLCLEQDLVNELSTPLGDLWCHEWYGFDYYRFLHLENTEINRLDLLQELGKVIERNTRVKPCSVKAQLVIWDLDRIKLKASCVPITGGNPINLVIEYSQTGVQAEVT